MTGAGAFVVVCANGRERDDVRRLGLLVAGADRLELLVLATAERALRGMTVTGWAITEWARHELAERPFAAADLQATLRARWRPDGAPR